MSLSDQRQSQNSREHSMQSVNPYQGNLFSLEQCIGLNPLKKYETLFSFLPAQLLDVSASSVGRPAISKDALLKVLIYKNLKPLPTLLDTGVDLIDNPSVALRCGLLPGCNPHAIKQRLSTFLRATPNEQLQTIRRALITQLVALNEISGTVLSIDSCPIPAHVKENNLKTSTKNRFDKSNIPHGDTDARLGIMVHFTDGTSKKVVYFWGYRHHVIIDALSELPLAETTKPANVSEQSLCIPLLIDTRDAFHLPIHEVLADAGYDTDKILSFIMHTLNALPRVARNPRNHQRSTFSLSAHGKRICAAGFEMLSDGTFHDGERLRRKFICPIKHSKKFAQIHPACPWNHPQFINGKGCYAYVRVDESIRKTIDYASDSYKKSYKRRTSSERVFSRLLTLCMQNPSVVGLNAIANHCTIAHITVLLVAITASKTGNKDKIRFLKSLLPFLS
jgi:hypothetical protein